MDLVTPAEWEKKRPSAYWRGFKTGPTYDENKFPQGRLKLVMSSLANGTMTALRGEWGRRYGDDLLATPLDALFTNRSRFEFQEIFP